MVAPFLTLRLPALFPIFAINGHHAKSLPIFEILVDVVVKPKLS